MYYEQLLDIIEEMNYLYRQDPEWIETTEFWECLDKAFSSSRAVQVMIDNYLKHLRKAHSLRANVYMQLAEIADFYKQVGELTDKQKRFAIVNIVKHWDDYDPYGIYRAIDNQIAPGLGTTIDLNKILQQTQN